MHTFSVQTRFPVSASDLLPWLTEPELLEVWLAHQAELSGSQLELQRAGAPAESWTLSFSAPLRIAWSAAGLALEWSLTPESPVSTVLQLKHSGLPLELAPAESSRWRIDLAFLRFALAYRGNPPAIHRMSCLTIPADPAEIFPALVYPQWLAEWLVGIELGRMLESTRRDAAHEWPEIQGLIAFRLQPLGPAQTRLCLELRAWDGLRLSPDAITARFEDSLAQLASWW